MPSWNELTAEVDVAKQSNPNNPAAIADFLRVRHKEFLTKISELRDGNNVIFYASGFLQKPQFPQLSINHEDINGFMAASYGSDFNKPLTLVLHTPGGVTNATETIIDYISSKYPWFEVIIPTFAMSAGTMISLAATHIVMGRQSQLGPIDPQLMLPGRTVSARAIVNQFDRAKAEISSDTGLAHLWAPILTSLGPALLQEAQNNLDYSECMVARWLENGVFKDSDSPADDGLRVAKFFNDSKLDHKSHGRRIGRDEAREQGLSVEDLEDNQDLQEAVLSAYHVMTIIFDRSPQTTKYVLSNRDEMWVKNVPMNVQP
jgi:hypothetical protein